MKTASLALAIMIVAAGPALAKQHTDVTPSNPHHAQSTDSHASMLKQDPFGVYVGKQEIGRDPDPNIREELKNEYFWG